MRNTTHTVAVGGAAINVNMWGDGPPVLLLHRNPDNGTMWEDSPPYRIMFSCGPAESLTSSVR